LECDARPRGCHLRPPRSWTDVAELGLISLYWTDKDALPGDGDALFALNRGPDLNGECRGEIPRAYLIQAVAKLAMGGADV
jgi:hypothetical protein